MIHTKATAAFLASHPHAKREIDGKHTVASVHSAKDAEIQAEYDHAHALPDGMTPEGMVKAGYEAVFEVEEDVHGERIAPTWNRVSRVLPSRPAHGSDGGAGGPNRADRYRLIDVWHGDPIDNPYIHGDAPKFPIAYIKRKVARSGPVYAEFNSRGGGISNVHEFAGAIANVVVPGRHNETDLIGKNEQGDNQYERLISPTPEDEGVPWDVDYLLEFRFTLEDSIAALDEYDYVDEKEWTAGVDESFAHVSRYWEGGKRKAEAEAGDEWNADEWESENPKPTRSEIENDSDRADYVDTDRMEEVAEEIRLDKAYEESTRLYAKALADFKKGVQAQTPPPLHSGVSLDAEALTSAVRALNIEIDILGKMRGRGAQDRTRAEMAVLNAFHMFTGGAVDVCRDPGKWEIVGGGLEAIGDWSSPNGDEDAYFDANEVLNKLANLPQPPTAVWRGMSLSPLLVGTLIPGARFDLRDVASFSTDESQAREYAKYKPGKLPVVLVMTTNRGTVVHELSSYPSEKEMLIGGHVYVEKVRKVAGRIHVHVSPSALSKAEEPQLPPELQKELDDVFDQPLAPRPKIDLGDYWRKYYEKKNLPKGGS